MARNAYFDNHPEFQQLSFALVVGIIQLMIDENLVCCEERNGFYHAARDFRGLANAYYASLDQSVKTDLIEFFRYKRYLCPVPAAN
ncbi:hypothetical protein [Mucilaginibacter sp. UYCu711]|uniref:hypothetical protein n=1 Tax=Mucilaginibacter sp. UYCu711 TaxID=3156339 RepID=UPI003D1B4A87